MYERKRNVGARYIALAFVFSFICLVFIIVLAVVQIKGPQTDYFSDDANVRRVTVSGLRGEIYDRNGVLLVGNSTSYDLIYEYGAMPESFAEVNAELLGILDAMEYNMCEDCIAKDYFALEGVYPNVRYREAVADTESNEYYYLQRVLKRNGLDADTDAQELAEYYIKRCKLSSETYSDGEIIQLMRLWYEMDRVDFGVYASYTVATDVPMELVTYIKEKGIDGATFKTVSKRVYNYPDIASHVLGRVGKITAEVAEYYEELGYPMDAYVGVSGCELAFEDILHGQDGTMVIEYDDYGNIVDKYYETEPISGNDVWLTIDIELQIEAERSLAETAESIDTAGGGAVTVMDPNTGAVLAIASYPTYDLGKFSDIDYYASLLENTDRPLFNRALSGAYAPGSTYKVGAALAALEKGAISDSTSYTCNKVHLHDLTCLDNHGPTNVYKAIQESCNIFFYHVGENMGIDAITKYTAALGLGSSTGIELAEREGNVATSGRDWSETMDAMAAIGQATHSYTPLQLSVYMSSIVNGGVRMNAHILDSTRHFYTDEALTRVEASVAQSIDISGESFDILMDAMGRVVYNNSEVYTYFRDIPDTVDGKRVYFGGKTGTAEMAGQIDNALFTGFALLDGEPQIVVSCIIEEGQHGYYASRVAADVMRKFFAQIGS